jgi:hypothetical protein
MKGSEDCIGTLNVLVMDSNCLLAPEISGKIDLYCAIRLNRQELKTRVVPCVCANNKEVYTRWNQALMFSVGSLDDSLSISLFHYDKYSQDGNRTLLYTIHCSLRFF